MSNLSIPMQAWTNEELIVSSLQMKDRLLLQTPISRAKKDCLYGKHVVILKTFGRWDVGKLSQNTVPTVCIHIVGSICVLVEL